MSLSASTRVKLNNSIIFEFFADVNIASYGKIRTRVVLYNRGIAAMAVVSTTSITFLTFVIFVIFCPSWCVGHGQLSIIN